MYLFFNYFSSTVVFIFPHPSPTSTLSPTPLLLCLWVLYTCSLMTLPILSPVIPLPSRYHQSVLYSTVAVYIFCLLVYFVDQVLLIGEIIWYVSFTTWLISLSIMLSSSIHAVANGRSSFFLSTA